MYKYLLCISILFGLFFLWTYKGIAETGIHVDLAGDLNALSDLWVHKMVWLGPRSDANFPYSPLYYYLLFPGLLLSGGNGLSVIISNSFFALLALGLRPLYLFSIKKIAHLNAFCNTYHRTLSFVDKNLITALEWAYVCTFCIWRPDKFMV